MDLKKTLMGILVSVFLAGCVAQPLTKNVINDIDIDDIDRFQYYTSAEIRLTATERIKEAIIDKKGAAKTRESAYRDVIIIGKNTKGVLMNSRTDEDDGLLVLEICFEEKAQDSDKRIIFKQEGPGLNHRFIVVYNDPPKRLIQYGDREFKLETDSGERVYLKVRIDKSKVETERVRRVKGRQVEN